jgi:hypothetical protein
MPKKRMDVNWNREIGKEDLKPAIKDNNRISRKTIGFSKKIEKLDAQMSLYFSNYNFCREHRSLRHRNEDGVIEVNCPAKEYGLINHNWSLRELLTVFP